MRKKICFIITKSEVGGAQKWVKEQIDLLSNNFETYLITNTSGWLTEKSSVNPKNILVDYGIEKRISINYLFKLISFLKKNKIEMIVASSANAGLYSRIIKLFMNIKVIYVSHGWSAIYNGGVFRKVFKNIEYFLSYLSDSILCISEADYSKAKNEIKIPPQKLVTIKNKINPVKTKKSMERSTQLRILTVSRLSHPKRLDLLIRSVKNLNCILYIVGDGPLKADLMGICAQQKINNVVFLGEIKSFDNFNEYDAFALISESEGLPLSALEAMSAGLPLILSNVGGCSELIYNNGILVENKEESIIKGIKDIINYQEVFSNNSKMFFDKYFNLINSKEIYERYYNSI